MLEKLFGLTKAKTTVKTEIMAGVATFLTMAYITVVNPAILSTEGSGMDFGAVFTATIIAAVVGTLIMGLWANWPVALAPGMGLNAFFTFGWSCVYKDVGLQSLCQGSALFVEIGYSDGTSLPPEIIGPDGYVNGLELLQ